LCKTIAIEFLEGPNLPPDKLKERAYLHLYEKDIASMGQTYRIAVFIQVGLPRAANHGRNTSTLTVKKSRGKT